MSANPDTTVQANFRAGDALINYYGRDTDHLRGLLDESLDGDRPEGSLVQLVGQVDAAFKAISTVAQVMSQPASPQAATQQQAPDPTAPSCRHGSMTFKEGVGAKGPWSAHFCSERDKSQQCPPQWTPKGR